MRKRIEWIDFCRGLAILAVVVCHQQHILHNSEIIQYMTLFSVTTLIFLAGLTKGMSLSKCFQKENLSLLDLYLVTLKKLVHIVLCYLFATLIVELFIYQTISIDDVISSIINFNALPPLYFVPIYIKLSFCSPLIYIVLKKTKSKLYVCLFLLGLWFLAYYFEGKTSLFCGSYLFVYGVGMVVANTGMPSINKKNVGGGILILLIGAYFAGYFYYSRVCGDYLYSKLIDILDPKYQLNPPNLSIIIYSTGVVLCAYYLFESLKNDVKIYRIMNIMVIIGRHSLDIFIWHMAIQYILVDLDPKIFEIRAIKILVFYFMMIMLPIYIRDLWEYSKRWINDLINNE